jgi:hypothetical protein
MRRITARSYPDGPPTEQSSFSLLTGENTGKNRGGGDPNAEK